MQWEEQVNASHWTLWDQGLTQELLNITGFCWKYSRGSWGQETLWGIKNPRQNVWQSIQLPLGSPLGPEDLYSWLPWLELCCLQEPGSPSYMQRKRHWLPGKSDVGCTWHKTRFSLFLTWLCFHFLDFSLRQNLSVGSEGCCCPSRPPGQWWDKWLFSSGLQLSSSYQRPGWSRLLAPRPVQGLGMRGTDQWGWRGPKEVEAFLHRQAHCRRESDGLPRSQR